MNPKQPRLGVLCWGLIGGSSVAAQRSAKLLASSGFEVHIAGYSPRADTPPLAGLKTLRGNPEQAIAAWAESRRLDLVQVHHGWPLGAIAARALGGRIAFTLNLHGTEVLRELPWLNAAEQACALAAPSQDLADRAEAQLSRAGSPRSIAVLPSPLGPEWFEGDLPIRPRNAGRLRVAHVSTGRAIKQVPVVLRACGRAARELDRQGVRLELDLIGPGQGETTLRLARELGLAGQVRTLGCLPPGPAWTDGAGEGFDALLLASRFESFSLVAQEALARGVEPIGPAVGGLPECYGELGLGTWVAPQAPGLDRRLSAALVDFSASRSDDPERPLRSREILRSHYGWPALSPLWKTWSWAAAHPFSRASNSPYERLFGPQRDLSAASGSA